MTAPNSEPRIEPSREAMDRFVWHRDGCDDDEGPCACDYHLRLEQFRMDLDTLLAQARREALEEAAKIADEYNEKGGYTNWSDFIADAIRALAAREKA